jgi:adenine-specific DNA-methyltransferase
MEKTPDFVLNPVYRPYDDTYINSHYNLIEEGTGRRYQLGDLTGPGGQGKGNPYYELMGFTGYWRYSKERMAQLVAAGRVVQPSPGTRPRQKRYLDEMSGLPVQDVWDDINPINSQALESVGYATQKPEALLERIIRASSNEDDLVLDCFCGSGTTAAVAEKLGRRWIAADLGRFAIHTTRKRLLSIDNVRPFAVQNLGKYERQAWQVAEFAEGDARQSARAQLAYRRFMLDLYRAQPLDGYTWLHGVRDGRLVHVGGVDAPVSQGDVRSIVQEFWKVRAGSAAVNAVDVLGWDFAFELNEVATQMAAEANVRLRFKRIPREVLEKKAVEQGDIKFFELAALSVAVAQKDREGASGVARDHGPHVTITLTDFTVPPDEVPEDVIRAVTNWIQWIDYWAVDWDYKGDAFHNMAQEYRTRKAPQLQPRLAHTYDQPGTYTVVVKVIDILGNDTTKSLTVEVR